MLHGLSARADRPFVPINCAAILHELLESELFSHARGAFTGAHTARAGMFQLADGGTIFLDEIGEIPLALPSNSPAFATVTVAPVRHPVAARPLSRTGQSKVQLDRQAFLECKHLPLGI